MIIIDTGPIVALFDKDDQFHKLCKQALSQIDDSLITTWPVLTEVMYLLNYSAFAQDLCLEFIESGAIEIAENSKQIYRIHQLMKQYQDLSMDFADASIVALSEEKRISTIFTVDHKDFRIYVPKHIKNFHLIPEKTSR